MSEKKNKTMDKITFKRIAVSLATAIICVVLISAVVILFFMVSETMQVTMCFTALTLFLALFIYKVFSKDWFK